MSKRLPNQRRFVAMGNVVLDGDRQDSFMDPDIATAVDKGHAETIVFALEALHRQVSGTGGYLEP